MQVKVIMRPNQEEDVQTFDFDDLDISLEDWSNMSLDERRNLLYEYVQDNIYGAIDEIIEI